MKERRRRRAQDPTGALRHQLDACREDAALQAIMVSDDAGVCLAASGPAGTCDEIAARLPMIGRGGDDFAGILLCAQGGWSVQVKKFHVGSAELYACTVGGKARPAARQLARSVSGAARILGDGA